MLGLPFPTMFFQTSSDVPINLYCIVCSILCGENVHECERCGQQALFCSDWSVVTKVALA